MSIDELIRSIHTLENHLQKFEEKYHLRSEDFYQLATQGKLEQSEELIEWLGVYEIKLKRERAYHGRIAGMLTTSQKPLRLPLAEPA